MNQSIKTNPITWTLHESIHLGYKIIVERDVTKDENGWLSYTGTYRAVIFDPAGDVSAFKKRFFYVSDAIKSARDHIEICEHMKGAVKQ